MTKNGLNDLFPYESQIPEPYRMCEPVEQRRYLINGELRTWQGPVEEVKSPVYIRTEQGLHRKTIGYCPRLPEKEAMEALDAAVAAYGAGAGEWPTMSVPERIGCLEDFLFKVKDKRAQVVNLLMWEIGKNLPDSEKEFDRTMVYIRDTIDALKELDRNSSRFTIHESIIAQVRRAPLGVVLCMGPFNYPLNETYTTLIPALIMGNTLVFKPPRFGVLLHEPLLEAFKEAFPRGVVNAIYGDGKEIIPPLMKSGKIDCFAFIGTSRVADAVKSMHPKPHRLRSILGLEAKNPAIILRDADLSVAVKECILGSLSFNGQRCTAIKIIFVHRSIIGQFTRQFADAVDALKPGMPWDDGTAITPLPEPGKCAYLQELIDDARKQGAAILNSRGGECAESLFFPAVLSPVNSKMRVWSEEQFGPLVPVVPFEEVDEAVRYIQESSYGQQVAVFGEDSAEIARLVDPLVNQVCRVNVNAQCQRGPDELPFTGRKDSAEGTLSVSDALRVFSIRTLVATKETGDNKRILTEILSKRESKFLSTDFVF